MTGIPVSQIPNAAQPGVALGPEAALSGPANTLLSTKDGKLAMKAGSTDGIYGVPPGVLTPAVPEGRDLSHFGDRAQPVGAMLDHYAQLREAANDYSALNQAAGWYRDGQAQLLQATAGQSEDDAQAQLKDFASSMQDQTAGLSVSPAGQARLDALHRAAVGQAAQAVTKQATGEFINRTRGAALDQYNQLMDAGAYEAAHGVLQQGASLGLFRPGETDAIAQASQRAQQEKQANAFLTAQPFDAQTEMSEARARGQSEAFPWMTSEDIARYHGQAQQAAAQTRRQVSDGIDQAVFSGQLTDPATVRQMAAQGRLPESEVASHIASLGGGAQPTTPEEQAQALRTQSQLQTAIENYDPKLDADGAGYFGLKTNIRQGLPSDQRAQVLKTLQERQQSERDPASLIRGGAFQQIDFLANRIARTKASPADRAAAWQKASQWKEQISDYMQKNPEATAGEVQNALFDLIGNDVVTQKALNSLR